MMVKEYFIERFGVPVHTIGTGGSGGSMQQHLIAQNYPGLLDGLTPTVSYPDAISIVPGVTDCSLLDHAFKSSRLAWSAEQKTAASGYATWGTCATSWFNSVYSPGWVRAMPTGEQRSTCDASIPRALLYDPVTNPKGARCDVYETQVNIYGRDGDRLRAPASGQRGRPVWLESLQRGNDQRRAVSRAQRTHRRLRRGRQYRRRSIDR